MTADLGQKLVRAVAGRLAEENCLQPNSATDGLFEQADTFNAAMPIGGEFSLMKCGAEFLYQRVLAA